MLSRVEDVRVFESSDDVILRSSSLHYSRQQQLNGRRVEEQTEVEEDEMLHPQHPYRMRKRVLQRESEDVQTEDDHDLMPFGNQKRNHPMEFVFLSSGEIRSREDCPPGLGLPKLQQDQSYMINRRLEYHVEEDSDESDKEEREYVTQKQVSRQQVRRQQHNERFASSPSTSSSRSESSVSEDADVPSDDSEVDASKVSEKEERALFQSRRQATRNAESRAYSAVKTARSSARRTPTRSLKLNHLRIEEEDEVSDHTSDRAHSVRHSAPISEEKTPASEATSRESRQRPVPLKQVSQLEDTHDVPTRRTKRSPKMEVSHLTSEEPIPIPKGRTISTTKREGKMIDRLESELQKEKKRVLEKMTQLLDEQGKNQQLRDRVEALEAQLAAKDSEMSSKIQEAARRQEVQMRSTEKEQTARINALKEQVRLQEAKIARLKHGKDQLKSALKHLKTTGNNLPNGQHLNTKEAEVLRSELDDMNRRLHEFLTKVEHWKSNSKKVMQSCDDKTDFPALLEHVWLDFPQFSGVSARPHKETSRPASEQQQQSTPGADEQTDTVLLLKKRLRQREDELRQNHVKYVELKELCARQCVREADLQNFINEHRLRGNLIICKNSGTKPNGVVDNQELAHDDHQDEHQHSSVRLKMISSRSTNTPAPYNERGEEEDNFVNDEYSEYSDNQDDNDDYEEGEEYEYPVRVPKVFVQVGRDGVYEHASSTDSAVAQKLSADRNRGKRKTQSKQQQRVERIRLVPSPSLAQRYERVPTPTTTCARRKKPAQQQPMPQLSSSRSHPAMLGECPPGCGSRPSFMRRKTSTAATRAKSVKRTVATTASKGTVGVIRPWM